MSLLRSFCCWGHLAVVLLSAGFFALFGIRNWRVLAVLWALVPVINIFCFSQAPIFPIAPGQEPLRSRVFWVLMLLMVCTGASEQGVSQWASAFAESALHLSKTAGALAGPCAFAPLMGAARALYGRFSGRVPPCAGPWRSARCCAWGATRWRRSRPTGSGLAAGAADGDLKAGILAAAVFPALTLAGLAAMARHDAGS